MLAKRLTRGALLGLGLGLVAGGMETAGLAATSWSLPSAGAFVVAGVVSMLGLGVLAALASVVAGLVVFPLSRHLATSDMHARQMGVVGTLLVSWYLWPAAIVLVGQGRMLAAAFFSALPLFAYVVVTYNARYWLRRSARGDSAPPWLAVSAGLGVVLVAIGVVTHVARDTAGGGALEGDPNVVVVTVSQPDVDGPGTAFPNLILPIADTRAAHASLWTGLHPLRARVLDDGDVVLPGHNTVVEVFQNEGYATAAFTSAASLQHDSGLGQGFAVYDDAASVMRRVSLVRRLVPGVADRADAETVSAFASWYAGHQLVPHLAWIQVADGAAAAEVVDIVEAWADNTLVAVVGMGNDAAGLGDDVVNGSLQLAMADRGGELNPVEADVRLYDVAPTLLEFARIDGLDVTEGVELIGYTTGARAVSLPLVLVGRSGDDIDDGALIGFRSGGVLYRHDLAADAKALFDLDAPDVDIAEAQASTLERASGMLGPDTSALRTLLEER